MLPIRATTYKEGGSVKEKIFEAKDVVVKFNLRGRTLTAIRGASIDLYQGETLAIVGESGSGKSVFTKSFIGMLGRKWQHVHGRS